MNKTFFIIPLISILMMSCGLNKSKEPQPKSLSETLWGIQNKGILFGHQDDLAYGQNWKYVDGESDVKRVSGDYPAVFGWDLGGLERGDELNLDGVPFDVMSKLAIQADSMGGVNTFSWHPYSLVTGQNAWYTDTAVVSHILPEGDHHQEFIKELDRIAEFLKTLKDAKGNPIEFIFRPWHEMSGNWFWWGTKTTTPEEYKQLFRFTVDYLKNTKGIKNMMVCYSPNGGYKSKEEYLIWYPGDDVVDMLGVDIYEWPGMENWVESTQKDLSVMIEIAKEKNKLAAFTETGCENIPDSTWFTEKLYKAMEPDSIANNISYVLLWRNDPTKHHFFAYDGHPSEVNAKEFLSKHNVWLLKDFNSAK